MNLLVILSPIIICFLAILITLIGKWMTIGQLSHCLIPVYILMSDAVFVFTFVPSAPTIAIVIILAVCASAGAFMHDMKTYISGFAATAIFLWMENIIYGIVLLILCAMGLIYDKSSKHEAVSDSAAQEAFIPNLPEEYAAASSDKSHGHFIVCISGIFEGAEFSLQDEETITIGSSPLHSQIILSGASIAEYHCKIWFDQTASTWCVIDFSNGATYQSGGIQLKRGVLYNMEQGSILYIGNEPDTQQFKLL